MIYVQMRNFFGNVLDKTWNSHQMGNSVSVSSLPLKLRVLTIFMFHNLYLLSYIGYMNLGRALFLHDRISDVEIDICAHIFHVLRKTVLHTKSRICVPFCCLISRILKLKGIHPIDDDSPCTKPSPINMRTFNSSIGQNCNFCISQWFVLQLILLWWKTRQHCGICPQVEHQDVRTHIYPSSSQHSVGYEIHLSTNSIGSDLKEARRRYGLAIPWQKGGDDVLHRGRNSLIKGREVYQRGRF